MVVYGSMHRCRGAVSVSYRTCRTYLHSELLFPMPCVHHERVSVVRTPSTPLPRWRPTRKSAPRTALTTRSVLWDRCMPAEKLWPKSPAIRHRTCRATGFSFFVCPRIDLIVDFPHFRLAGSSASAGASVMKYGWAGAAELAGAVEAARWSARDDNPKAHCGRTASAAGAVEGSPTRVAVIRRMPPRHILNGHLERSEVWQDTYITGQGAVFTAHCVAFRRPHLFVPLVGVSVRTEAFHPHATCSVQLDGDWLLPSAVWLSHLSGWSCEMCLTAVRIGQCAPFGRGWLQYCPWFCARRRWAFKTACAHLLVAAIADPQS